jgi:hypothetical protein
LPLWSLFFVSMRTSHSPKMSNCTSQDGRWHRHSPVSRVEAVVIACTRDSSGDISYSAHAPQGCSSGEMATRGGRGSGWPPAQSGATEFGSPVRTPPWSTLAGRGGRLAGVDDVRGRLLFPSSKERLLLWRWRRWATVVTHASQGGGLAKRRVPPCAWTTNRNRRSPRWRRWRPGEALHPDLHRLKLRWQMAHGGWRIQRRKCGRSDLCAVETGGACRQRRWPWLAARQW